MSWTYGLGLVDGMIVLTWGVGWYFVVRKLDGGTGCGECMLLGCAYVFFSSIDGTLRGVGLFGIIE